MKLHKIVNVPLKFKIDENQVECELREFSLMDEEWISEKIGEKKFATLFQAQVTDFVTLARVIFNQLKDKSHFALEEFDDIDENGVATKVTLGGYKKLLRYMDSKSRNNVLCLLWELRFRSMPDEEEGKKKADRIAKIVENKTGKKIEN